MAIQSRRGNYADFDPAKMVAGEWAVVRNGDPSAEDGKAVYMAFGPDDVKRMATYNDMQENIENATEEISQAVADEIEANVAQIVQTAQTAAQTATDKADEASQSASSVSASAAQIETNKNDISDLKEVISDKDLFDDIPGTTQTVTFNANDQPISVVHTSGTDTVRSDVFTWGNGTVTEVRTLADGRHVTYVTNLTTLVTTISEVEEAI